MSRRLQGTKLLSPEEDEFENILEKVEKQQAAMEGVQKIIMKENNLGELLKLKKRLENNNLPNTIQKHLLIRDKKTLLSQIDTKINQIRKVKAEIPVQGILSTNSKKKPSGLSNLTKAMIRNQTARINPNTNTNVQNKNKTQRNNNKKNLLSRSTNTQSSIGTGVQGVEEGVSNFQKELQGLQAGETLATSSIGKPVTGWTNTQEVTQPPTGEKKEEEKSFLRSTRSGNYDESLLLQPSNSKPTLRNTINQYKTLKQEANAVRQRMTNLQAKAKNSKLTGLEIFELTGAKEKANKATEKLKEYNQIIRKTTPTTPIPFYIKKQMNARKQTQVSDEVKEEQQTSSITASVSSPKSVQPPSPPSPSKEEGAKAPPQQEEGAKAPLVPTILALAPHSRTYRLNERVIGEKPKGMRRGDIVQEETSEGQIESSVQPTSVITETINTETTPLTQRISELPEEIQSESVVNSNTQTSEPLSQQEITDSNVQKKSMSVQTNLQHTTASISTNTSTKKPISYFEKAKASLLRKIDRTPSLKAQIGSTIPSQRTVIKYEQKQDSRSLLEETRRILQELKELIATEIAQMNEKIVETGGIQQNSTAAPLQTKNSVTTGNVVTGEGQQGGKRKRKRQKKNKTSKYRQAKRGHSMRKRN